MNSQMLVVMMCLTVGSSVARLRRQNYHGDLNPVTPQYNPVGPPYTLQPPYNSRPSFRRVRPSNLPPHQLRESIEYGYNYEVEAPGYGSFFGHQEQRQGEVARGKYYVLLPDGRTQTVEYTADQDGYHPTISYQGRGGGGGGGYHPSINYPRRLRQGRLSGGWQDY